MLAKEAADQVVAVADAAGHLPVGREQGPGVLEPAEAERERPRPQGPTGVVARIAAEDEVSHPGEVVGQDDVDEVGVQGEQQVVGPADLGLVLAPEAGRGAEAETDLLEGIVRAYVK